MPLKSFTYRHFLFEATTIALPFASLFHLFVHPLCVIFFTWIIWFRLRALFCMCVHNIHQFRHKKQYGIRGNLVWISLNPTTYLCFVSTQLIHLDAVQSAVGFCLYKQNLHLYTTLLCYWTVFVEEFISSVRLFFRNVLLGLSKRVDTGCPIRVSVYKKESCVV